MKGLILKNLFVDNQSRLHQASRLKCELENLGCSVDVLDNNYFTFIDNDGTIKSSLPLSQYDFCVFLDNDKYISEILEKEGLRLFNTTSSMNVCADKYLTFIKLANNGIPMPKTIGGLLCPVPGASIPMENVENIEQQLGKYPIIVKSSFGSLGSKVYKIDNRAELIDIMEKLKYRPHLFQKFISASCGMDLRVVVIGGKFVAGYKRRNESDFRSNLAQGGKSEKVEIPKEVITLCEKVAQILQMDYCGIDVLIDTNGYKICEVNSNAFFDGVESTTNVNVAKAYAEHIINTMHLQKR